MDAKELAIGDWVQQEGCTNPTVVYGVSASSNRVTTLWADGKPHAKDGWYFKPIPLTHEILEKNGFRVEYAPEDYRYEDEMLLTRSYDRQGYWWVVGNMYVCQLHYVHELQHALRLCGLYEMANNFKLSEDRP